MMPNSRCLRSKECVTVSEFTTAPDAFSDFDVLAFVHEYREWLDSGGREKLDRAMESVQRYVARMRAAFRIDPRIIDEVVSFTL